MIRRPPRSTLLTHSFPTRRSSDLLLDFHLGISRVSGVPAVYIQGFYTRIFMRDLDLITLRLFVAVCELRSIARAGEQSNIVGSAISKRLLALEETVGVKLLIRRRHGVVPTPAGETLLEHARAMLTSADRIRRDMQSYASGVKGQVRVLATASALAEQLAEDLAVFLKTPDYRRSEEHTSELQSLMRISY